jgi:hypothetical protein
MERLTIPDVIIDKNTIRRTIIDASEVRKNAMEFYWRLKEIEDIISDDESEEYDLDRLRELAQADREGRCVVLPAKPDQIIYQWRKGDDCPSVSRLDGVQISGDGEITYPIWCGHLTPGDFGKTVFLTREEAEAALEGKKND